MKQNQLPGKFRLSARKIVQAPARNVWEVVADFPAVETWAPQVTKSYALGAKERGVGAERHCDIKGFGGIDEAITEWTEGRSLAYRVTPLGPLGVSYSRWTVNEINDTSSEVLVELSYDLRFGLFGRVLHKIMMRRKLKQAFSKSLEALKKRVETGMLVRPRRSAHGGPQLLTAAA